MQSSEDRAYLSIVQWPDGWTEEACGRLLSHAAQIDEYNALLAAKRGAPGVVAMLDPDAADQALAILQGRGVMATAPRRSAMLRLPDPVPIKRLAWHDPAADDPLAPAGLKALTFERWRGNPSSQTLHPADLRLIVRARTTSTERRVHRTPGGSRGGALAGYMAGGLVGAAIGSAITGGGATASSKTHTAECMDIYLKHGPDSISRLRIDSGRFDASILGETRGLSARDYLTGVTKLLHSLNPRVILDTGFDDFRAPADVVRTHFTAAGSSSVSRSSNAGAFEFFSEWAYLLYESMRS